MRRGVDCLNSSYFEISGHIVECSTDDSTSLLSSKPIVSVAERPERGRDSARSQASSMPQKSSLFAHWRKTSFHQLREFGELPGKRKIGLLTNPRAFGLWGISKGLEVVDMHYDYFIN